MAERWSGRLLEPGERVAGYEVEAFVARGGMAVVYRARDVALGRPVALKVIAPELAAHDKFRQRFMRESELAASLDHPNIIPVYAAGEADHLLYLVMRFVPGVDLGTVLKQTGALGPREALPLFTQVAGALDAAHAHGLVHRDVKPGNILLTGDEDLAQRHVYLGDFGLTKRMSSLTGFTTAGHFLGTIQYVAPEQVANRPVDHRSDIYSLACVLYEALAGEPPFVRDDDAALLWSHMTQDAPPITERRPDLPAALDPVFQRALSKDPDDRQQNCRALLDQVRTAFRRPSRQPEPPPPTNLGSSSVVAAPRRPTQAVPDDRHADPPRAPAPRPSRPSRARRHVGRRTAALLLGLVVLAGLATWLVWDRVTWEHYSGTGAAFSEAAVPLDHPRSWRLRRHEGQFVVFSPQDVTPIFTPTSNWAPAQAIARDDPDQLVGAYVESGIIGLDLDPDADPSLPQQVESLFEKRATIRLSSAEPPAGTRAGIQLVNGTMTAKNGSPDPTLYVEVAVVPLSNGGQGRVLLFCKQEDRAKTASTFERVIKSIGA